MFLDIDKHDQNKIAAIDDRGMIVSYGELTDCVKRFCPAIESRSVAFILSRNCVESLIGYLAMIQKGVVPLILNRRIDNELLESLINKYEPLYIYAPIGEFKNKEYKVIYRLNDYELIRTSFELFPISDQLQFLMTTSGSTGSPKLVRYKKGNLEANAKNVALAFEWTSEEKAICDLGMQYTMGLNVINTHLYVGATVLLTDHNIMSGSYWDFVKAHKGSNFTGVPFSYDILHRLHYERMDIDCIRTFSQGGGKMTDERFREFAEYCDKTGRRFIASFGTTETSARMCVLNPILATTKTGSIGKEIPEGRAFLIDHAGNIVDKSYTEGELCYSGPNVTMGYAIDKNDLSNGDDWNGEYRTGDMAIRDEDGCYYVTGRKGRFLKLLGHRVGLDECERMIVEKYNCGCACIGDDTKMKVFVDLDIAQNDICLYLSDKLGLYKDLFEVSVIKTIPRNDRGKVNYNLLQ